MGIGKPRQDGRVQQLRERAMPHKRFNLLRIQPVSRFYSSFDQLSLHLNVVARGTAAQR